MSESGRVRETPDGVTYTDGEWFVAFAWVDEAARLVEYVERERVRSAAEVPESERRTLRGSEFVGTGDVRDWRTGGTEVPDDARRAVEARGYAVLGGGRPDRTVDPPAEAWVRDGDCPHCGETATLERLRRSDVCLGCGRELPE